jgi:hypothetical protein
MVFRKIPNGCKWNEPLPLGTAIDLQWLILIYTVPPYSFVREVAALQGGAPFSVKSARYYRPIKNEGMWEMRERVRKEFLQLMATTQTRFLMLEAVHPWPERPVRYGRQGLHVLKLPSNPFVQYKRGQTWWTRVPITSLLFLQPFSWIIS